MAPVFWSPNYFVVDYGWYGVAPPPPDDAWIRYGPDLVLIQLDTGAVLQEIPGAFVDGSAPQDGSAPGGYLDAPPGFSAGRIGPPEGPSNQPDVIRTSDPAYPTEPPAEAQPAFRYADTPAYTGDPDELPGDPPPPGAG